MEGFSDRNLVLLTRCFQIFFCEISAYFAYPLMNDEGVVVISIVYSFAAKIIGFIFLCTADIVFRV